MTPLAKTVLSEIEEFLVVHNVKPTVFGRRVCGDPHLVKWLRRGHAITTTRVDKIRNFIAAHQQAPAHPVNQDGPRRAA